MITFGHVCDSIYRINSGSRVVVEVISLKIMMEVPSFPPQNVQFTLPPTGYDNLFSYALAINISENVSTFANIFVFEKCLQK